MTENEAKWEYSRAIDLIKRIKTEETHERYIDRHKAFDLAIQALEEIQQYRAIGTVEDFKNAVEIIRPRKPYKRSFGVFICSLCGEKVGQAVTKTNKADCMNFCANCGSMIDWSE